MSGAVASGGGRTTSLLDDLAASGLVEMARIDDRELLLGTTGRFWAPRQRLQGTSNVEDFIAFDRPGSAKALMWFGVEPSRFSRSHLLTETRVEATTADAARVFLRYWAVIRPFSELIRVEMLRAIARRVDRSWPCEPCEPREPSERAARADRLINPTS